MKLAVLVGLMFVAVSSEAASFKCEAVFELDGPESIQEGTTFRKNPAFSRFGGESVIVDGTARMELIRGGSLSFYLGEEDVWNFETNKKELGKVLEIQFSRSGERPARHGSANDEHARVQISNPSGTITTSLEISVPRESGERYQNDKAYVSCKELK